MCSAFTLPKLSTTFAPPFRLNLSTTEKSDVEGNRGGMYEECYEALSISVLKRGKIPIFPLYLLPADLTADDYI